VCNTVMTVHTINLFDYMQLVGEYDVSRRRYITIIDSMARFTYIIRNNVFFHNRIGNNTSHVLVCKSGYFNILMAFQAAKIVMRGNHPSIIIGLHFMTIDAKSYLFLGLCIPEGLVVKEDRRNNCHQEHCHKKF